MPQELNKDEMQLLDASTAEEIDALEINLLQDGDEFRDPDDGTGRIDDEIARDQIEGMTEVGPELVEKGVDSVAPGSDDSSDTLRRHRPATRIMRAGDQVERNQEEPRDEVFTDREADEGAPA
jgi:N utilization substance protein A